MNQTGIKGDLAEQQKYLSALFDLNEWVGIGETKYSTDSWPLAENWRHPCDAQYVTLNPLKPEMRRADANAAAFRNFLVEMDRTEMDFMHQYDYITKSALPLTTAVSSAGKSIHFVVALKESIESEATWRFYAEAILKCLPYADQTTKNPSRFTRLGEGIRPERGVQKVLYVGERIELADLTSWLESQPAYMKWLKKLDERAFYEGLSNERAKIDGYKLSRTAEKFLMGEAVNGSRNHALFVTACDLKSSGLSEEETVQILVGLAEQIGLTRRESLSSIKSAFRRKQNTKESDHD